MIRPVRYGYHCNEGSYFMIADREKSNAIFERMRNHGGNPNNVKLSNSSVDCAKKMHFLSQQYPPSLGPYKVTSVRDLTTGYDSSTPDGRATLPLSREAQMITLKLCNGVVLTVRTSGTEPKLKYYVEYCAKPEQT